MRSLALLAALAACGGSSPPPVQTSNTAPVTSAEPAPSEEPASAPYGGDPYGGGAYGGDAYGGDPYVSGGSYTPPPHRTDAEWAALLARPIPTQYPTCLVYRDAFAKFSRCDKLPAESKDAMYQGYEAFIAVFDSPLPAEAAIAMNDGCKAGADALAQVLGSLGCTP